MSYTTRAAWFLFGGGLIVLPPAGSEPALVGQECSAASPCKLSAGRAAGSRPEPRRLASVGFTTAALARTRDQIEGLVTSPVLTKFNPVDPTTFAFRFAGSVNAHPSEWFLAVDVLNPAGADPRVEANWVYNVATFRATGGGPEVFTFSAGGIVPFASLPEAWKPGGLGRLRVVAAMDADPNQWAALTVQDSGGFSPANETTLVVAATTPDPTKPTGASVTGANAKFNPATPNYLSANSGVLSLPPTIPEAEPRRLAQQRALTAAYYTEIGTSERGTGPSIRQKLPTLRKFIDHYFRPFECPSIFTRIPRIS